MDDMKILQSSCAAAFLLVSGVAMSSPLSAVEIYRLAAPNIVTVHAFDQTFREVTQGSGVVFAPGRVVTNCHLFGEGAFAAQVRQGSHSFAAYLIQWDVSRDLCILGAPDLAAPGAAIGSSLAVEVGAVVYAIGAPKGLELTISDGLISGRRGEEASRLLQITAPISPGSSGGGLFASDGTLIGITTLFFKDAQQINFAVPIESLLRLIHRPAPARPGAYEEAKQASERINRLRNSELASTDRSQDSASAKDAITKTQKARVVRRVYRYTLEGVRRYGTTVPRGATNVELISSP